MSMFEGCGCTYDYGEGPYVVQVREVTARQVYTCQECEERIQPGASVRMETGFDPDDGKLCGPWVTCRPCATLRDDYCGSCYTIGALRGLIEDREGFDYITGETYAVMEWNDEKGEFVEVPE